MPSYINRRLASLNPDGTRSVITEDSLSADQPLLVLGEPGAGKTELLNSMAARLGIARISAARLVRLANPEATLDLRHGALIIDAVDEVSVPAGASPVDEVLRQLSRLDYPSFVMACRSADWEGSIGAQKILEDYGIAPIIVRLEPLNEEDATLFLSSYLERDAAKEIRHLFQHGLGSFTTNPLTLRLVGELLAAGQSLPTNRTDLFDRAANILIGEYNPAHNRSNISLTAVSRIMYSAGSLFCHLLLSGIGAISTTNLGTASGSIVHISQLDHISEMPAAALIGTRLFKQDVDELFVPFHRVLAEFLAGRWLGTRDDLSTRRIASLLVYSEGIPAALRGVHAWLATLTKRDTERYIANDPFGILRYGDPAQMSLAAARATLSELSRLSADDPFFRSEDWSATGMDSLVRTDLRGEIVALLEENSTNPQLRSFVLESLKGSELTPLLSEYLIAIVGSSSYDYYERSAAAEALAAADLRGFLVDFVYRPSNSRDHLRLLIEIVGFVAGSSISPTRIAELILDYERAVVHEDDAPYVVGVSIGTIDKLSSELCASILDSLAILKSQQGHKMRYFDLQSGEEYTYKRLAAAAFRTVVPDAQRLWAWVKAGVRWRGRVDPSGTAFETTVEFRREFLKIALYDGAPGETWETLAYTIPASGFDLMPETDDALSLLDEILSKASVTPADVEVWHCLVRYLTGDEKSAAVVARLLSKASRSHPALRRERNGRAARHTVQKWEIERRRKQAEEERERQRRFGDHQRQLLEDSERIKSGHHVGALISIACAYLARYSDLSETATPRERLVEWLGEDASQIALEGLRSSLFSGQLPSFEQIIGARRDSQEWKAELVLISGAAELFASDGNLQALDHSTAKAVLAALWYDNRHSEPVIGKALRPALEEILFTSREQTVYIIKAIIEPELSRPGHSFALDNLLYSDPLGPIAAELSVEWLSDESLQFIPQILLALLTAALQLPDRSRLASLSARMVGQLDKDTDHYRVWLSTLFVVDLEAALVPLIDFVQSDAGAIWALQRVFAPGRRASIPATFGTLRQSAFIIEHFSERWPFCPMPGSSMGSENPWNATEFILQCINSIASFPTNDAGNLIEELVDSPKTANYRRFLLHARAEFRRNYRESTLILPGITEVKTALAGGLPASIDDLKAVLTDQIDSIRRYLRDSDTRAWEAFWNTSGPKSENVCRDRLLDILRPRLPASISLLPETTMPDTKRSDIMAVFNRWGVPIEIKGQWHPNVWNAAELQLADRYTRDWRADGRGIYLVLWFGDTSKHNLRRHPDRRPRPSTALDFEKMLKDTIPHSKRGAIEVVVLDVSRAAS